MPDDAVVLQVRQAISERLTELGWDALARMEAVQSECAVAAIRAMVAYIVAMSKKDG